jgi:hypothetical protein
MSSLLSSIMSSILSSRLSLVWRMRMGAFQGAYELSLLPNFGKHVAYKLWNDKVVSIIALFNLMILFYLFY